MPKLCLKLILSLLIALTSCTHTKNDVHVSMEFPMDEVVAAKVEEVFACPQAIPLTTSQGKPFYAHIERMEIVDSIFVMNDNRNVIYLFSPQGILISSSEQVLGHAANEYSVMTGYALNPYTRQVEVLTPTRILFYDLQFNFLKSVPLPSGGAEGTGTRLFNRIYALSANMHALAPYGGAPEEDHEIIVYDSRTQSVAAALPYDEDVIADITMQAPCFYPLSADTLFFYPPCYSRYMYKFCKRNLKLERWIGIRPGHAGLETEDLPGGQEKASFLLETDKGIPLRAMPAGGKVVVWVKRSNTLRKNSLIVLSFGSMEAKEVGFFAGDVQVLPQVMAFAPSGMYAVAEAENLPALFKPYGKGKDGTIRDVPVSDSGMCILKYPIL